MNKKEYKCEGEYGKYLYSGDSRYEKIWEQMQLLGIEDISTMRQEKNSTIVWKLPIKDQDTGILIEVASFKSGYVRNQGKSCHSNYQLNKRCESEPEYYETAGFKPGEKLYRKYTTRTCKLIPIEIDRLEYLISYCLKNYYIKHANFVADGEYVSKWRHEYELEKLDEDRTDREAESLNDCGHYERITDLENKLQSIIRTARH